MEYNPNSLFSTKDHHFSRNILFAKFKVIYLKLFKLVRLGHFQGGVLLVGADTVWRLSQLFRWVFCVDVLQCLNLQFYVKVKY